ncbi:DUF7527 domain-containing protein [Halarchaeum salinum]|uniref:DUF7527 domain-containing protein n=1 Tax=Halarchaeum salinum TaxID=489912 RepID=A0AAV3S872_9EURY
MQTRTAERVESWDTRPYSGGADALAELAAADFSGVVAAGGAHLFFVNGRAVTVADGTVADVAKDSGEVRSAPERSLALLLAMHESGGETRARYYTNETPLAETDEALRDAGFTGYIELSENVLSGDYYVAYYGGRSFPVAFVGNAPEVFTGEEAFERAADEVGVYEVVSTDLAFPDLPEPEEPVDETAAIGTEATDAEADQSPETAPESGSETLEADDATTSGTTTDDTDRVGDDSDVVPDELAIAAAGPADGSDAETTDTADDAATGDDETDAAPNTGTTTDAPDSEATSGVPIGDVQDDETTDDAPDGETSARSDTDGESALEPLEAGSDVERDDTTADARTESPSDAAGQSGPDAEAEPAPDTGDEPALDTDDASTTDAETTVEGAEAEHTDGMTVDNGSTAGKSADGDEPRAGDASDTTNESDTSAERGAAAQEIPTAEHEARVAELREAIEEREARIEAYEDRLAEREERVETLTERAESAEAAVEKREAELDRLRGERDDLRETVAALEERVADLEADLEAAGGRVDPATERDPEDVLAGTNLFVRYESKADPTLSALGEADPEAIDANLRLEHHTSFDAADTTVAGDDYRTFLEASAPFRFVSWVVRELPFEIAETGHRTGLADLYEAIPEIDRAELDGTVSVTTEDGETVTKSFDVVLRDGMGEPLVVAALNTSREPVTGDEMEALTAAASAVCAGVETLGAAVSVTASFFEPDALETANDAAASGGFLRRSEKESYVKVARKRGYHLCLVEDRAGSFHVTVPEL